MLSLIGFVLMTLGIGLGGGFIGLSVGTTENDKLYKAMRKAQGYEL